MMTNIVGVEMEPEKLPAGTPANVPPRDG